MASRNPNKNLARASIVNYSLQPQGIQDYARRLNGTFNGLGPRAAEAHHQMAQLAAVTISDYLQSAIASHGRTQGNREHESLVALLKDERNLDYNINGWVVGRDDFLESGAAAPYYRNLERGTTIFVGRQLNGFFQSLSGTRYPASQDRYLQDPRLRQTNRFYAGKYTNPDTGQTFDSAAALRKQLKAGDSRKGRFGDLGPQSQRFGRTNRPLPASQFSKGRFGITIKRPIVGYRYFTVGGARFLSSGAVARIYAKELKMFGVRI